MSLKVLFIFGTRPEAIKLCAVIGHMKARPEDFEVRVCVTAQHREMLDQVPSAFDVVPDCDLDTMQPGQTLYQSTSRILAALDPILEEEKPEIVFVQGDTTTTFCGALAAFYAGVPVDHVEAGLRTGDLRQPFPEEMNRILTTRLATLHFAPTQWAAENLFREGVERQSVFITGNTAIDAILQVAKGLECGKLMGLNGSIALDPAKKTILVTAHRRENFGDGIDKICEALVCLARRGDVQIVYPVHPNPHVSRPVRELLANHPGILLIEPLSYVPFVDLMRRADILLTDSGGIQEEAPSLGKPVLVMRRTTERPEGVPAGVALLVGTDATEIVNHTQRLLEDLPARAAFAKNRSPYGDGSASASIAAATMAYFRVN